MDIHYRKWIYLGIGVLVISIILFFLSSLNNTDNNVEHEEKSSINTMEDNPVIETNHIDTSDNRTGFGKVITTFSSNIWFLIIGAIIINIIWSSIGRDW